MRAQPILLAISARWTERAREIFAPSLHHDLFLPPKNFPSRRQPTIVPICYRREVEENALCRAPPIELVVDPVHLVAALPNVLPTQRTEIGDKQAPKTSKDPSSAAAPAKVCQPLPRRRLPLPRAWLIPVSLFLFPETLME
jgi:hypothetical protein